jgi:hypothetical protein
MKDTASPKKTVTKHSAPRRATSLIEFPGVNRSVMPEWRKELGERVREVQERRAREATIEAGEESKSVPILELLPQAEASPMNPLVVAALRRIERAHSQNGGQTALATALAYEEQPTVDIDPALANSAIEETVCKPERIHILAVVPTPEIDAASDLEEPRRPRRVIDDHNPALNYLDSIPTSVRVDRLGIVPRPSSGECSVHSPI